MCLAVTAAAPAASTPRTPTLIAAGDVAACDSEGDEATARLVARIRGTVAVLGDSVYNSGTDEEYARCYAPSWGRFKARTRPAVGNHEYGTAGASGYFRYFGARARPPRAYYSYDLGRWHVVVLNTNCGHVGGCNVGSPQEQWLRRDLAASRRKCTLAYMHHPRFSSGSHGSVAAVDGLWRALYDARVEITLAGHDHHYERFVPQDPLGRRNRARGIRHFVVGTGGRSKYELRARLPTTAARQNRVFGVLVLKLRPGGYGWRYVPVEGTYRDTGSGTCR